MRARKKLAEHRELNGPFSIADRLAADGVSPVPSRATIAGLPTLAGRSARSPVTAERSSFIRALHADPTEHYQPLG